MKTLKIEGVEYEYKGMLDNRDGTYTLTGIREVNRIKVVPSGRIDWCCECKAEHGYDCPKDKPIPCPLTNSSHEKALVRVVENYTDEWGNRDFIQVLCSCGHIISSNEIK